MWWLEFWANSEINGGELRPGVLFFIFRLHGRLNILEIDLFQCHTSAQGERMGLDCYCVMPLVIHDVKIIFVSYLLGNQDYSKWVFAYLVKLCSLAIWWRSRPGCQSCSYDCVLEAGLASNRAAYEWRFRNNHFFVKWLFLV